MKKIIILLGFFMVLTVCGNSQTLTVFEEWTTTTGTQNMFLENVSITNANGGVYIGGATLNSSGDYDILLTRYGQRGNLLWTVQYAGDGNGDDAVSAISLGDSGNIYLTGTVYTSSNNQNDCVVLKYDAYGSLKWARTYHGNGNGADFGTDICIDANDNVYIGGSCTQNGTCFDFLVLKYDRGGNFQWVNTYDNIHLFDIANNIEINGNIVVVAGGTQIDAVRWDYAITNFDASTGSFAGVKISVSSGTGIDKICDLFVDGSGNIYVTGGAVNAGTGYDFKTIKLDDTLAVQWTASFNGDDDLDDIARSVCVDANGNVIVTGYSLTQCEDTNMVTIKYNSSGVVQWVKEFNDDNAGSDKGEALVIDDLGNIYIAATYFNGSNSDYLTMKYSTDGDPLWKMTYNGLNNQNDEVKAICIDDNGDILVVGQSYTGDEFKYLTVKYSEIEVIIPPDDEEISKSLDFIVNRGQLLNTDWNPVSSVQYYSKSTYPELFFLDDQISFVQNIFIDSTKKFEYYRVDLLFIEANSEIKIRAFDQKEFYYNYELGQIPEVRERVSTFNRLFYSEMYPNIDIMYTSNNRGIKYYYIVKPGGDIEDIHMSFLGADSISVGFNNELIIYTPLGEIIFPKPKAYQIDNNGDRVLLAWQPDWNINGSHLFFTYGSYDSSLPLIFQIDNGIDNVFSSDRNLTHSTYWGDSKLDEFTDAAVDASGNIYVTGFSYSTTFPSVT
jgi:hypothetical protein